MTESRFRLLLAVYVCSLVAAILSALLPSGFSAEIEDAIAGEPEPALFANGWLALALLGPFFVAVLAGLVGLFRFSSWGRSLSLYTTIGGFLLFPFLGPAISSGLGASLTEACSVLWGAVLACAYFSPVSARFAPLRHAR
jgi:hypothetical protein